MRTEKDFQKHNEEVARVWDAFNAGKPVRVPMVISCNVRMLLLDRKLNQKNVTFKEYSEEPGIMLEKQMEFQNWYKLIVPQDARMGIPAEGLDVSVDLQNYSEAAWFGCEVNYRPGQVPDTEPILSGDKKNLLFDKKMPEPLSGIMAKNIRYYEYFLEKKKEGYSFEGSPVNKVFLSGMWTDGVFTAAVNLRGTELFTDLYEDPAYVKKLLAFINQGIISRLKALKKYCGEPEKNKTLGFADDSIANISTEMYREFVLPFHKELVAAFSNGGPNSIHLCGDSTRHFKTIRDELNVKQFDTGFPVDFSRLRKELGEDVTLYGGPNVNLLLRGDAAAVRTEVKRILQSGIATGGKFILKEANNLAPETPLSNLHAMYETVKEPGKF